MGKGAVVLVVRPVGVTFGGAAWAEVASITVERKAVKAVEAWSDDGPHAVFVDVPERRVTVRVTQALTGEDLAAPGLGDEGTLRFETGPNTSAASRTAVSMTAVVVGVSYGVSRGTATKAGVATRTVELIAVSPDGAADPVSVSAVG